MANNDPPKPGSSVLVVAKAQDYMLEVVKIARSLKGQKVCFITTNKGYSALEETFKISSVDDSKFFFLDCVTRTVMKTKDTKYCKYVSSPSALTEIEIEASKRMKAGDEIFVVDSLSTLMIYQSEEKIARFVHNLISNCKSNKRTLVILIADGDRKSDLYNKVSVMVDEVLL
jgi:KaiC/GvpD/RAD55 family RecA-like ATPase